MGAPVTFISENEDFDPHEYPFMIAPAFSMTDSTIIRKWQQYAEKGGNLILTCRTGSKDNNGHFPETLLQQPIWKLIGASVEDTDQLPPSVKGKVETGNNVYDWNVWAELLSPEKDTETLASYADQFYSGTAAVTTRKVGKGTITYIGVWTNKTSLEESVLRTVYQRAGAKILDLPEFVYVEWRDGFWVAVNYGAEKYTLPIPSQAKILSGNKEIKQGEVTVWK